MNGGKFPSLRGVWGAHGGASIFGDRIDRWGQFLKLPEIKH